jgi:hypothetical protein
MVSSKNQCKKTQNKNGNHASAQPANYPAEYRCRSPHNAAMAKNGCDRKCPQWEKGQEQNGRDVSGYSVVVILCELKVTKERKRPVAE